MPEGHNRAVRAYTERKRTAAEAEDNGRAHRTIRPEREAEARGGEKGFARTRKTSPVRETDFPRPDKSRHPFGACPGKILETHMLSTMT